MTTRARLAMFAAALLAGTAVGAAVWAATPAGISLPAVAGKTPAEQPGSRTSGSQVRRSPEPGAAIVKVSDAGRPAGGVPSASGPSAVPVQLTIPALHVTAPVVPVTAANGLLGVPPVITTVGWWAGGAAPGAHTGTAVFDGHVDSATSGLGALWPLRFARPGEQVTLGLAGRPNLSYRVTAVRSYPKADLPAPLFVSGAGPPTLVLITCGGRFDSATGHYADNVVVYAVPGAPLTAQ